MPTRRSFLKSVAAVLPVLPLARLSAKPNSDVAAPTAVLPARPVVVRIPKGDVALRLGEILTCGPGGRAVPYEHDSSPVGQPVVGIVVEDASADRRFVSIAIIHQQPISVARRQ